MKHTKNRVVIKIDVEEKNSHQFKDGTTIILRRDVENLNKRQTMPVNATVISGEGLNEGDEILIHHNSIHDSNRVFNSELDDKKYKVYSIPYSECFLFRNKKGMEWKPLKGFVTALRVFKPYVGKLKEIPPALVKDVLYIKTGELKGKIVHTVKAADYQIVYQGDDGREGNIIRARHFEDEYNEREEIIAISDTMTMQLKKSLLLVGLNISDAKTLNDVRK